MRWGTAVLAEVVAAPGMDDGGHARRTIGYLRKALAYTVKDLTKSSREGQHEHFRRCYRAGQGSADLAAVERSIAAASRLVTVPMVTPAMRSESRDRGQVLRSAKGVLDGGYGRRDPINCAHERGQWSDGTRAAKPSGLMSFDAP